MWGLAPLIAFAAEIQQGVRLQSLMTFWVGFLPLLIFFASFLNKKSYWKLGPFDFICGALSIIGLILWYITKVGNIAIIFSILADFFAALPTITKSFQYPETESAVPYLTSGIGAILTILTITTWNFENFGFPIYISCIDLFIFSLITLSPKLYSQRKYDK